jgi:hypothetical protein
MPPHGNASLRIRVRTPALTEELVRFLRRMGVRAAEVDYGIVAVEPSAAVDEASVRDYLRIWQGVHARAAVELEPAATA